MALSRPTNKRIVVFIRLSIEPSAGRSELQLFCLCANVKWNRPRWSQWKMCAAAKHNCSAALQSFPESGMRKTHVHAPPQKLSGSRREGRSVCTEVTRKLCPRGRMCYCRLHSGGREKPQTRGFVMKEMRKQEERADFRQLFCLM